MAVSIVPVRIGSKSIPEKNIKNFCGKPLIYWTLESLQKSKNIDKIYVASDSKKINNVVDSFNLNKVEIYNRDPQNSTDNASTESVLMEVINNYSFNENEIIYLNQVTNPFVKPNDIDNAFNYFTENKFDSLLTCSISKRFFWNEDGTPINYDYNNRLRRQDFEGTLIENGAFYISNVKNILKHKNRLSGKIGIFKMSECSSYEIDDHNDWVICENLFGKNIDKLNYDYSNIRLVATDVDGVLTDSGMYYNDEGDFMKKFNTRDGMAFQIIKEKNILSAIVTSEKTEIVKKRSKKLNVDFIGMGRFGESKLEFIKKICNENNFGLHQVAYIGDDINCISLLKNVGFAACPKDAHPSVQLINNIFKVPKNGGDGAFRFFVDYIISRCN